MTEIYLHIVARMADYMATHPYRPKARQQQQQQQQQQSKKKKKQENSSSTVDDDTRNT